MEPEKRPADSATEMVQAVLPNDTNPLGHALGGRVLHWMDLVGAIVAFRHSQRPVVTVAMERVEFIHPIRVGNIVVLKAQLNFVGHSSMEVGVEVFAEDPIQGIRTLSSQAILTYVALDSHGRPVRVPRLLLESETERRRFAEGQARRVERLSRQGKAPDR